jgi:hypothetical protein
MLHIGLCVFSCEHPQAPITAWAARFGHGTASASCVTAVATYFLEQTHPLQV